MTVSHVLRTAVVVFAVSASEMLRAGELPCEAQKLCPDDFNIRAWCMTSKFWLEATSASGANGDVVEVTFSLHYAPEFAFELNGIDLTVCHDPSLTEIVGEPVYSEDVLARNPLAVYYVPVQEGSKPRHKGYGFYAHIGAMADRNPVVGELPLLTMYYRLTGFAGESTEISFCDGQFLVFGPASCNFSSISDSRINFIVPLVLSTQNQNGTLSILPGPATHPDRPPEPADAVVYPKLPTSDDVNLQMRIANAVAHRPARRFVLRPFTSTFSPPPPRHREPPSSRGLSAAGQATLSSSSGISTAKPRSRWKLAARLPPARFRTASLKSAPRSKPSPAMSTSTVSSTSPIPSLSSAVSSSAEAFPSARRQPTTTPTTVSTSPTRSACSACYFRGKHRPMAERMDESAAGRRRERSA